MAARFWVGGSGTWSTTNTTNWSATSGGAGGASVPTAADDVTIDGNSGSPTVTTNYNVSVISVTINAAAATLILGGTLNCSGSLTLTSGTFDTSSSGNHAVNLLALAASGTTLARTLNLNASTLSLASFTALTITNFTFNAGTSQINFTASTSQLLGSAAGLTFYNVAFTNTGAGTRSISGINTFNNLTVSGNSVAGVATLTFAAQQTINGTLSTTGTAGNRRVFFASATYGISVDLVVNSAPSLTDADFRGLYVRGTAAPISGTRIGNRGECRGITFSTPKTVFWNLAAGGNWESNAWATSSGGFVSTDNFPLPQDTAIIGNTGLNTGASIGSGVFPYISSVDMSTRTNSMSFSFSGAAVWYGDFKNGSGTALSGTAVQTLSGGTTQTITSAGKTFTCPITVDTYGGTVQLADALNIGTNTLTVTNGTFNTAGYAVTAGTLASSNSNVRTVNLGASTITLAQNNGGINFGVTTNLTFNSGTSTIALAGSPATFTIASTGLTFYDISLNRGIGSSSGSYAVTGSNIYNNFSITAPIGGGIISCSFDTNQTINGTLTCAGASAVRRIFLASNTIGTPRTLTVNSISADDCDFRDITLAGAAAGASPTRAGNCGGNTGITFPAAKTVYWNLAGAQNWSATGWCPSSGGTPDINQFPLAQDTAVFDNTGSVTGTITVNAAWNIGTFDASLRTSAMTLTTGSNAPFVYGDWKFGTGITSTSSTGTITFSKNGTQTITSNGVQFGCPVTINHPLANVQLADALSLNSARTLTLSTGTFDAVTYNVTTGLFTSNNSTTLKMGSGTWTLSGTGAVWNLAGGLPIMTVGSSTIVLSDTSTSARTFFGASGYYNKLTIGGTTGTSTLTVTDSNTFGELASTKTVAHTVLFQANVTNTFGKWAVTGTAGNVVTINSNVSATAFTLSIAGPANSGIDYLSIRDCTVATTSPGEFYVGANSTNVSNNTRVIFTATPAPRTLYWVGGTGNWSSTTKWDTTSGGGGGAAIPTSLDAVIFNSASNATAYTATIDAGVTLARCAAFTMAGPASGNVTFAGSVGIAFHGNVSFAATGITRTYTGTMNWAGNGSYTFTTNGLSLSSLTNIIGIGATWTLGSATSVGSFVDVSFIYGTFDTSSSGNYNFTCGNFFSDYSSVRNINLNASTITVNSSLTFTNSTNLTLNAGTSQFNASASSLTFAGGGRTFNNVSFISSAATNISFTGANTFNTLSFIGRTTVGIASVTFAANQTISTLTLNAGTASAYRTFLASNTIGTARTLNVTTLTAGAADIDFRDIAITGAAAPLTGTRFGDAKGNSGITFDAAKTVYWKSSGGATWGNAGTSWSLTNGGTAVATAFPLAQDTAYIPFATPNSGSTIIVNANYNIGTLDMNERNGSALVTLDTSTSTPSIYGNWINGTGTTLSGTGTITFAGLGSQTITSAGKTFTQPFTINTPGGSVTLQDALTVVGITHTSGTLNANIYNVTFTGGSTSLISASTFTRTLALGSGTWTSIAAGGVAWSTNTITGLTITGTGTISLTNASAKTFNGGGANYSGITLNQGGAGALTITGNNTFKDITNTYSATGATTIALGNTTQTLTNPWTATGAATRVLTVSGTSAASPGTLIFSGGGTAANVDYLNISNVRAYDIFDEWYAGPNSTNSGSLGWYFQSGTVPTSSIYYGAINVTQIYYGSTPVTAIYYGATQVF